MKIEVVTDGKMFAIRKRVWFGWKYMVFDFGSIKWVDVEKTVACDRGWWKTRERCDEIVARLQGVKAVSNA